MRYKELREYLESIPVVDTHEHLPHEESARDRDTDVLQEYLLHYMNSDLRSAGLSRGELERAMDPSLPILDRWQLVEPYWEASRHTGYARALDRSVRGVYGIDRIDGSTIEELNQKFLQSLTSGHFERVLKELCHIETSLLDSEESPMESDPVFFRSVYRIDRLVLPRLLKDIERVETLSGISATSLDAYLRACGEVILSAASKGVAAYKIALAYERNLFFGRWSRGEAERGFYNLLKQKHIPEWVTASVVPDLPFQDYVMHHLLEAITDIGLPVQIHTGLHEGSGNYIANSDPAHISNLLLEYPGVRFDIFHIGYPFFRTAGVLAKNFPNASLDMCWANIISPYASVHALAEWIDLVPYTKIFAFGGDLRLVDGVYGHLMMAKDNVAKALALRIEDGTLTVKEAERLGRAFFYDNPKRFFGL